jgi:hypothetical protein
MKIRIWYKIRNGEEWNHDIEHVEPGLKSLSNVVAAAKDTNGVFIPASDGFIPWHSINYFEQVEDGD